MGDEFLRRQSCDSFMGKLAYPWSATACHYAVTSTRVKGSSLIEKLCQDFTDVGSTKGCDQELGNDVIGSLFSHWPIGDVVLAAVKCERDFGLFSFC